MSEDRPPTKSGSRVPPTNAVNITCPLGRPIEKDRGREHRAKDPTAFHFGEEEAKSIERVRYLLPAEAEGQNGDRWMDDGGQGGEPLATEQVEVDLIQAVRRSRIDNRVVVYLRGLQRGLTVQPLGLCRNRHRRAKPDLGRELASQRVREPPEDRRGTT